MTKLETGYSYKYASERDREDKYASERDREAGTRPLTCCGCGESSLERSDNHLNSLLNYFNKKC